VQEIKRLVNRDHPQKSQVKILRVGNVSRVVLSSELGN
jgi:hypothetical protein